MVKKYVGVLGAEEDCGKAKGERARNEARQLYRYGGGEGTARAAVPA